MTHPVVAERLAQSFTTAASSYAVNLPASIANDDLLVIVLGVTATSGAFTVPAGWTLQQQDEDGFGGSVVCTRQAVAADSGGSATISRASGTGTAVAHVFRVTGWDAVSIPAMTRIAGSSTIDIPADDPTWATAVDTLVIGAVTSMDDAVEPAQAFGAVSPTNFLVTNTSTGSNNSTVAASAWANIDGDGITADDFKIGQWASSESRFFASILVSEGSKGGGASTTPVAFSGTVPDQSLTEDVAAGSLDLSTYFSGTETPFTYTLQSGTLPAGLSLNTSTGVVSGTPTAVETQNIVVRATDQDSNTADTNSFEIDVAAAVSVTEGFVLNLNNGSTDQANLTGIHCLVWDGSNPSGAPDYSATNETTDGSGDISVDLSGVAGIAVSDTVFVLLWKPDGSVDADSLGFMGRIAVTDIS